MWWPSGFLPRHRICRPISGKEKYRFHPWSPDARLGQFDILGFSLLYELNYTNVLAMLDLAGIPFRSKDRDQQHPLIIAGGPCTCNPEPVADFFDALVIGDGEDVVLQMADAWLDWQQRDGRSRKALLASWSRLPGVYVPSLFQVRYHDDGRTAGTSP